MTSRIFTLVFLTAFTIHLKAQNVGINTNTPLEKLHVGDGNLLLDRGTQMNNLMRRIILEGAMKLDSNRFAVIDFNVFDTDLNNLFSGARISAYGNKFGGGFVGLKFETKDVSNGLPISRMNITGLGKVGIGTNTPLSKLHVFGGDIIADRGNETENLIRTFSLGGADKSTGPYAELIFNNYDFNESNEYTGAKINSSAGRYGIGGGDLRFYTSTEYSLSLSMLINQNGKVGIGGIAPSELLTVGDSFLAPLGGNRITIADADDFSGINIGKNYDNRAYILWDPTSSKFNFGTVNGAIDYGNTLTLYNGKMGINNNSPQYDLHVGNGSIAAVNGSNTRVVVSDNDNGQRAALLGLAKTDAGTRVEAQLEANGNIISGPSVIVGSASSHPLYLRTANITRMTILSTGNVGINTTSPNYTLEVNGTAAKTGGGSWDSPSDIRLKENVRNYNDGLNKILSIRPVQFNYTQASGYNSEKDQIGVVAQELEKIAPYMVDSFEKEGEEFLTVNNSAMVYMLINAVKEMNQKIEDLETEIITLKDQVGKLESNNH